MMKDQRLVLLPNAATPQTSDSDVMFTFAIVRIDYYFHSKETHVHSYEVVLVVATCTVKSVLGGNGTTPGKP